MWDSVAWFLERKMDLDKAKTILARLTGEHDFAPFYSAKTKEKLRRSTIRTIYRSVDVVTIYNLILNSKTL